MNENLIKNPSPSFGQSIVKACHGLTDLNGRTRRSEFWWYMIVFYICVNIAGTILQLGVSDFIGSLIQTLLWGLAFAVTVRRLQDGGHSKWWVVVSWLSSFAVDFFVLGTDAWTNFQTSPSEETLLALFTQPGLLIFGAISAISGLIVFVFCCMDGTPGPNKYGESPKYKNPDAADNEETTFA